MFYVGLIVTVADVLIALAVANYGAKSAARRAALEQDGVLVDPETEEYQIDWDRSALVNGLMPAQPTVGEDNKTYDLNGQAGPLMEILQLPKANNIPLNGVVDARSNPVLRQQIQAVLHRAAGAAPAATGQQVVASGPVDTPPEVSIGERLQKLETLHRAGTLTDEEYAGKRAQIIAEL